MISLGAYEYNANHSNLLGSGAFAFVYKGRVTNKPDQPVAIKIMKKDQNMPKNKTLLSKEISVLKVTSNGVYLVMEYCNGGDLSEYLQGKVILPCSFLR
ncbi:Serine:threonine protein kinase ULK2 [Fasciola hepatica]|uniref:Serine:threonine protein kinase ULK2 n=1 Tax=Fasciola hepatica TaxID=6192 RepID=A0A4E0RVC6_FASHE|nr:Serine:threonine protein kinase ULK2 [Fasciola hepatica]